MLIKKRRQRKEVNTINMSFANQVICVTGGALGLAITLINPVNLWWTISPIETRYFVIGYSLVIEYLEFVQLYYWHSIGISAGLILFGYAIHIRSIKALYEGIKASPRALLTLFMFLIPKLIV